MKPTLRPVRTEDQEFLFKLYASIRAQEFAGLGWPAAQLEAFLRMQFMAQQRSYESLYEQCENQIVELNGAPIGQMKVNRGKDSALLVDISLLPEHRGQGLGGALLRELIQKCAQDGALLKLQVLQTNPAQRLYERLGFIRTGEDQMYIQMERRPE
jgi:ribosomal protein S18 acetylase RimI-like enzyme